MKTDTVRTVCDFFYIKVTNLIRSGFIIENPVDQEVLLDDLDNHGVSVIRNFVTAEDADRLKGVTLSTFGKYSNHIQANQDQRLFGIDRISPESRTVMRTPGLREIANRVNGCRTDVAFVMANILDVGSVEGSGGGWHRDSFGAQFKCMLYLNDVDDAGGPFEYFQGSHKLSEIVRLNEMGLAAHNQTRFDACSIRDILKQTGGDTTVVTGNAGDLVLFNSVGLHRGQPIQRGQRIALTSYYYPKHSINGNLENKFNPIARPRTALP